MHSRQYYEEQLASVDDILYKKRKALFYDRKFELHTLSEEQKVNDLKALHFLLNLTVGKRDEVMERKNELKRICIENKINNPIIGEKLYNPSGFDYSRVSQTFAHKIISLCHADSDTYHKYKVNNRGILEKRNN
jgi:hypothetical protein